MTVPLFYLVVYRLAVRYLEIFNEQIHDLLVPPKAGSGLEARRHAPTDRQALSLHYALSARAPGCFPGVRQVGQVVRQGSWQAACARWANRARPCRCPRPACRTSPVGFFGACTDCTGSEIRPMSGQCISTSKGHVAERSHVLPCPCFLVDRPPSCNSF